MCKIYLGSGVFVTQNMAVLMKQTSKLDNFNLGFRHPCVHEV